MHTEESLCNSETYPYPKGKTMLTYSQIMTVFETEMQHDVDASKPGECVNQITSKELVAAARILIKIVSTEPVHAPEFRSEWVEQAIKEAGLSKVYDCCGVPHKYCSTDTYRGELQAFSIALLRLARV